MPSKGQKFTRRKTLIKTYCNFFIISLLYLSGLVADLAQSGRATES